MTVFDASNFAGVGGAGFFVQDMFPYGGGGAAGGATATAATYTLADGRKLVVTGSGFVFSGGEAIAGNIAAMELQDGAGNVLVAITGLTADLATFEELWSDDTVSRNQILSYVLAGSATVTGSAGEDILVGSLGNDAIDGGGDNSANDFDTVDYSGDPARITGIDVNLAAGVMTSKNGLETDTLVSITDVVATAFADDLHGDGHDNLFAPGLGDDFIDGAGGQDILSYLQDDRLFGIVVALTGAGAGTVSGENGGETDIFDGIEAFYGTALADSFKGAEGDDSFRGFAGEDTFEGGDGSDTVDFRSDVAAGGAGIVLDLSTPDANGFVSVAGASTDKLGSIENIHGTRNADTITGTADSNLLLGDDGNDTLTGLGSDDTLAGGNGADHLFGGLGADTLSGDVGNDEAAGGDGDDQVFGGPGSDTLFGNAGDDFLLGGDDADVLSGGDGADSISGGAGNDAIDGGDGATDSVHYLALGGKPTTEIVDSKTLNILFDGLLFFTIEKTGSGFTVTDARTGSPLGKDTISNVEMLVFEGGNPADDLVVPVSAHIESPAPGFASFFGTIFGDTYASAASAADQVTLYGGQGGDVLTGHAGLDTIFGGDGADRLYGAAGADTLEGGDGGDELFGGTGADRLAGGAGNDTMDGGDIGDMALFLLDDGVTGALTSSGFGANGVMTIALDGVTIFTITKAILGVAVKDERPGSPLGTDEVINVGLLSFRVPGADPNGPPVSELDVAVGPTVQADGSVAGSLFDDVIALTTLAIPAGITFKVSAGDGKDVVTGHTGPDIIDGGAGDDILDGNGGQDTLIGGSGNDTYYAQADDTIVESKDQGTDTVYTSSKLTLGANLENVVAYGNAGPLVFSGNPLGNRIVGGSAGDTLDGKAGADTLVGGHGNDTYVVDNPRDIIVESKNQGKDEVIITPEAKKPFVFTLPTAAAVETLHFIVPQNNVGHFSPLTIHGNSQPQAIVLTPPKKGTVSGTLFGGGGNDSLSGGNGKDTLYGGAGKDSFVFATKPSSGNVDSVKDYSVAADSIWLDDKIFDDIGKGTSARPGKLVKASFFLGERAHDASDRVIYDPKSGVLSYDEDGSGRDAAVILSKGLKMTAADFFVI